MDRRTMHPSYRTLTSHTWCIFHAQCPLRQSTLHTAIFQNWSLFDKAPTKLRVNSPLFHLVDDRGSQRYSARLQLPTMEREVEILAWIVRESNIGTWRRKERFAGALRDADCNKVLGRNELAPATRCDRLRPAAGERQFAQTPLIVMHDRLRI